MNESHKELLALIANLSAADPELRLGQLVANIATLAQGPKPEAVWDTEDDEMIVAARRLLSHYQAIQRGKNISLALPM